MMIVIPLVISLLIGYFLNALILNKTKEVRLFLLLFLSFGLGLGISAITVFFSFIVCNQWNRPCIISLNLFVLAMLCALYFRQENKIFFLKKETLKKMSEPKNITIALGTLSITLWIYYYIFFCASRCPYGDWDGWAVWNMKMKFLTLSGTSWQSLFNEAHAFTQPDYPLLLPCINIWLGIGADHPVTFVPMITGILFTLSCAGLLLCGLLKSVKYLAILAFGLLVFLPYYIYAGTSQYADIVLAYFLLAGFIALITAIREHDGGFYLLSGILLGLMAFAKNEGILMALLLTTIVSFYLVFYNVPNKTKHIKSLVVSLAAALLPTIIFKFFLAPVNQDVAIENLKPSSPFFNFEGCYMIFSSVFHELISSRWQYVWFLIGFAVIMDWRSYWHKEIKIISMFFISFAVILFFVYLGTTHFSLMWRLSRTLPRILFYLYPSVLFLVFYAYGYKK